MSTPTFHLLGGSASPAWVALPSLILVAVITASCGDDSSTPAVPKPSLCVDSLDCPVGLFCVDHACVEPGGECVSDADCGSSEVCTGGYCMEEVPECVADDACPGGRICVDEQCQVGCRTDDDCDADKRCGDALRCETPPPECPAECPPHQQCNETRGVCEGDGTCGSDGDCDSPLVCNEGVCGPLIETCDVNADCSDGKFCDRSSGLCEEGCRRANECSVEEVCVAGQCTAELPACEADDDEPNDSDTEAEAITPGLRADRTLCGDEDWYSFFGFAGDDVSVTLSFIHDNGDINVQLLGPDGEPLLLSASTDDDESLARSLSETGIHLIRVFGNGRGVFNTYTMDFQRIRTCEADSYEDNDTLATATVIEAGTLSALTLCEEDDDWFALEMYPGETLSATLTYYGAEGDLSLELYDATGALLDSSDTSGDEEILESMSPTTQTLYLKIPGRPDLINGYDLTVDVASPACTDDGAEDDDDLDTAAPLGATPVDGQICNGDEDWRTFFVPADIELEITADFVHANGDLNLELFGPDGSTLALADSVDDNEVLTLTTEMAGTYALRVFGVGRSQNNYTLSLASSLTVSCPADDVFEDNDSLDTPAALSPGATPNLAICDLADEDWFEFPLAAGQSFEVLALASADQGNLELSVFAPDALDDTTPLDSALGDGETKRVRARLGADAGTYRVRVRGESGADILYSLRLHVYDGPLPLDCEFDDAYLPNQEAADAKVIAVGETVEAVLCSAADSDWFRIDVEAGDVVTVRADFLEADADLDLKLHTLEPLEEVASVATDTDNELLNWASPTAQTLLVQALLSSGEQVVYNLTVSTIPGAAVELDCSVDDAFEDNDLVSEAAAIPVGSTTAMHCGADDDFFKFPVLLGEHLRVSLVHDGSADDLEMNLYNTSETLTATAPAATDPVRVITDEATSSGDFVVGISAPAAVDLSYSLWVEVSPSAPAFCGSPDALEPNTDVADATRIDADSTFLDLGLCADDEDWFTLLIPADQQATIEAVFDDGAGNLDLEAYGPSGLGVSSSRSTTSRERLVVPGSPSEDTRSYLRAMLEGPDGTTDLRYDMSVTYEELVGICEADAYEPNDSLAEAAVVADVVTLEGSVCPGDEDWYTSGAFLSFGWTATLTYDPDEADLDLEVTDGDTGAVYVADGEAGSRIVMYPGLFGPTTLSSRVFSVDGRSAAYTLDITQLLF